MSKSTVSMLNLPHEILLMVVHLLSGTSKEQLHLRAMCKGLNDVVLAHFEQETRNMTDHPFSSIRMGLDPAFIYGLDMISKNEALSSLPYIIDFDFGDTSYSPSPSYLRYQYIKEGAWEGRYGLAWGALQLLLVGLRDEGPCPGQHEEGGYRRDRFIEARALEQHHDKYSSFLAGPQGQRLLKDVLSHFPSLSEINVGQMYSNGANGTSLKRSLPFNEGLSYPLPDKYGALQRAMEVEDQLERRCGRPCEYMCLEALINALSSLKADFKEMSLIELDPGAFADQHIPRMLAQNSMSALTSLFVVFDTDDNVVQTAEEWHTFLAAAKSLQFLCLRELVTEMPQEAAEESLMESWFAKIFDKQYWPHLVSFIVCSFPVSLGVLSPVIMRHAKTLRRLDYDGCGAPQPSHLHEILKQLRSALSLKSARVKLGEDDRTMLQAQKPTDVDVTRMSKLAGS